MKDFEFKALKHTCTDFELYSSGKAIQENYSPDCVLICENKYVIIEHETEPNRKTVIADIFKASYFLQNEKQGILIIVLTPKGQSSFESYPKHFLPYFNWLKERTNLQDVHFVHETNYYKNEIVLAINGEGFEQNATSLKRMQKATAQQ